MNNLDWSNVEDEKDKRIRELEDTLRKQKELMEILQVLGKNCINFQIMFCSQRKIHFQIVFYPEQN